MVIITNKVTFDRVASTVTVVEAKVIVEDVPNSKDKGLNIAGIDDSIMCVKIINKAEALYSFGYELAWWIVSSGIIYGAVQV